MVKNNMKGFLWNILGSIMWGTNSFVMLMVVSWFSSVEQVGDFAIALTTAQNLYLVGLLGTSHYHMTDYGEKYQFSDYTTARFFSCILMMLTCIVAVAALRFSREKAIYTILLTILMLINAVGDLYHNLFFQNNKLDLSGSSLFYRTFWSLTFFCIILAISKKIVFAILGQISVNFILTMYYIKVIASQFIPSKKVSISWGNGSSLMRECCSLFGVLLLMNIITHASKYGVEYFMDETAQGYYNIIFMPAQVIHMCSQFLLLPMLKRYSGLLSKKNTSVFFRLLRKQFLFITVFTIICCIMTYFFGASVMGFIYRKNLSDFSVSLTLVVFGGGIFAVCQFFYFVLVILRQQKQLLMVYAVTIVYTTLLTSALTLSLGFLGAVLSFIVTHVTILLGDTLILNKIL